MQRLQPFQNINRLYIILANIRKRPKSYLVAKVLELLTGDPSITIRGLLPQEISPLITILALPPKFALVFTVKPATLPES
jgi:hypothetical protein